MTHAPHHFLSPRPIAVQHPVRRTLLTASLLALVCLLPPRQAAAQQADDDQQTDNVFAGVEKFASHAKESNEVTLDKNMLGLAGGFMGSHSKDLAGKMDSVVVREYEYASPGQYRLEDVEQIQKRLEGHGWSHLVRTRETTARGTEITDICVRNDAEGTTREMVIIDAEPTELSFIHLRGHLSAKELSELGGSFGIPSDLQLKQRPPQ